MLDESWNIDIDPLLDKSALQEAEQAQGQDVEEAVHADLLIGPFVHRPPAISVGVFQSPVIIFKLVLAAAAQDDILVGPVPAGR